MNPRDHTIWNYTAIRIIYSKSVRFQDILILLVAKDAQSNSKNRSLHECNPYKQISQFFHLFTFFMQLWNFWVQLSIEIIPICCMFWISNFIFFKFNGNEIFCPTHRLGAMGDFSHCGRFFWKNWFVNRNSLHNFKGKPPNTILCLLDFSLKGYI